MSGQPSPIANSCGFFPEQNFRTSKGVCAKAVRAIIGKAGIDTGELKDRAYNLQKKGLLERAGFVNLIWKYNEDTAPLGSILIYVGGRGHNYGHVAAADFREQCFEWAQVQTYRCVCSV